MKKKGIILISILLFVGSIIYVKWDAVLYTYYYLMDNVFMNIGTGRIYYVYIRVSDDVVFSNGKKEFVLQEWDKQPYEEMFVGYTKDTPYYGIFSNCVVSSAHDNNLYNIDIKGGCDDFSAVSENSFDIWYNMYFFDKDGWCRSLQLNTGTWCKEFRTEIRKDYIRCYTDSDFSVNTSITINLNYKEHGYTEVRLKDLDFKIKSFEIRKNEDGKPMVYLDMDGDGVYEKDCNEYRYELSSEKLEACSQFPMKLTHFVPVGFENTEFDKNLGTGGGYLFRKTDGGQTWYYTSPNGEKASEIYAYGGVVTYMGLHKEFTDGKLTSVSKPYEYFSIEEEECLERLEAPAHLWKVSVDLCENDETEKTKAYFWCVLFSVEESDVTYALLLNAECFDKEDIMVLARSVRFSKTDIETPWYYYPFPSVQQKDKLTISDGIVYRIGDKDTWEYDSNGKLKSGPYIYDNIPVKIIASGKNSFSILDEEGRIHSFSYWMGYGEEERISYVLEKFNSRNPYVCVNSYDYDKSRKTLLEDGRIIGILDDVVVCNIELSDEKIIYLSGDFALSNKGNVYQIELFQDNGVIVNQSECIYDGGDIVDIDAYYGCVAVKSDGEVLYFPQNTAWDNRFGEGDVSGWQNVVTVECDRLYSVGLTSDGQVLFAGSKVEKECSEGVEELSKWKDITQICAVSGTVAGVDILGNVHIVKLKP